MPYRTSPLRLEANDDGTRSLARALLALAALLAFATLSAVASDVASRLGRYEGAVDIERIAGHALDVAVPAALAWIAWRSRPRSACRRAAAIAALVWPASLAFEWLVPERAFAFRGHTLPPCSPGSPSRWRYPGSSRSATDTSRRPSLCPPRTAPR